MTVAIKGMPVVDGTGPAGAGASVPASATTFSPRMVSETQGFAVVGDLKWRVWNDVVADVWEVSCAADARGVYVSPDPHLFMLLEIDGGAFEITHPDEGRPALHATPAAMSFIPAGMPIRSRAVGVERLKHFDLHFDESAVTRRFGRNFDWSTIGTPRLGMDDVRIAPLAAAIAAECEKPTGLHDLYGDSLVTALLSVLFDVRQPSARRRAGLSRRQLAQVTEYMAARAFETIRLAELAALVGLSEAHFSHAFKASTGVPPYRWQMQARIRRVKEMLVQSRLPLADVALAAGFSDQAHFTRVFKIQTGVTPGEWRRQYRL